MSTKDPLENKRYIGKYYELLEIGKIKRKNRKIGTCEENIKL